MESKPTPDPSTAAALSAKGYVIVPCRSNMKGARETGWSKWDAETSANKLRTIAGQTGWKLVPKPRDPVKLVILDVDKHGADLVDFWRAASPIDKLPAGVAVARTVSGGLHLYFRAPAGYEAHKCERKFDLGSYQGDIFFSADGHRGLMLPGSVADGKQGIGTYTWERPLDIDRLPQMPLNVWQTLCAHRRESNARKMPTEVHRMMDTVFNLIPDGAVPDGTFSDFALQLGRILGRLWGRKEPPRTYKREVMLFCQRVCDGPGKKSNFLEEKWTSDFDNGWAKGYEEKKEAQAVLPGMAAAEAERIFGTPVTMQTNKERGKVKGYILTVAGKSEEVATLKDRYAVLGLLAQMSGCPVDELGQSPLLINTKYYPAFETHLHHSTRISRVLGDDLDEFKDVLRQQVRDAANAGLIGKGQLDGAAMRDDTKNVNQGKAWLKHSMGATALLVSCKLMSQILQGFSGITQKALEDIGKRKNSGFRYWEIPLDGLDVDGTLGKLVSERELEHRRAQFKKGEKK